MALLSRLAPRLLPLCTLLLLAAPSQAAPLRASGSTAATRLYQGWAEAYKITGSNMAYEPSGSSAGLKAVIEGKADFGASDVMPSEEVLQQNQLICIPTAITGLVPAINLPGVARGKLRLSGPILAAILSGKIRQWNDNAISRLNPGIKLPAEAIRVIAREDGSGSTHVLSEYLSAVSPEWKDSLGTDFLLHWPADTLLAKGSSGVAKLLTQTPNSISYLELGHVQSAELNYALVANKAGQYVAPGADSFRAALASSEWTFKGRFEDSLINRDDKAAWPITTGTFVLLKKNSSDAKRSAEVLNFLSGAFMQGDKLTTQSGFVPLPMLTQARAVKALSMIKDKTGVPVFFDVLWRAAAQ